MELFPAADEEQWQFIKRVISDCDYYILIIGGRYGSLTPDGISYTEQEYEFAKSLGLKVIAFVHEQPDEIPIGKSEIDAELREKLAAFRTTVASNRLVKFWKSASELPGLVALSLQKTMKLYPAVGWVRARAVTDDELLLDLNQLRKENEALKEQLRSLKPREVVKELDLAELNEDHEFALVWRGTHGNRQESIGVTWDEIFDAIAAELTDHPGDGEAYKRMAAALHRKKRKGYDVPLSLKIGHDDFQTIRLQLVTLGLVNVDYNKTTQGGRALFWTLTSRGRKHLTRTRTVKAKN